MSDSTEHSGGHGPSPTLGGNRRRVCSLALLGLIIIVGSLQVGIDWGLKGRRRGSSRSISAC